METGDRVGSTWIRISRDRLGHTQSLGHTYLYPRSPYVSIKTCYYVVGIACTFNNLSKSLNIHIRLHFPCKFVFTYHKGGFRQDVLYGTRHHSAIDVQSVIRIIDFQNKLNWFVSSLVVYKETMLYIYICIMSVGRWGRKVKEAFQFWILAC